MPSFNISGEPIKSPAVVITKQPNSSSTIIKEIHEANAASCCQVCICGALGITIMAVCIKYVC